MNAKLVAGLGLAVALGACASPVPGTSAQVEPTPQPLASGGAAKPSNESLTIDFLSGSANLSRQALSQLDGAARLYRDAQPTVMIVSGQSDKQGMEFPNLILSARRANAVKRALVDRGVPSARLQMVALGDAEPTPNVLSSRAVVVTWR